MRTKKLILTTLAASAFAISGSGLAEQTVPDNRDRMPASPGMAVSNADISMSNAITRVENKIGGSAVEARLFSAADGPVYLISLENPDGRGVIDVQVDADTGTISQEPDPMLMKEFVKHRSGV
jgi:uncharacterized membrane protein YkoI